MSGIYSMSTGFGMRRPMMGNRMSVTTTGGGGGGAPSYPARQPGMFQPKGTSLRDMLMHKGQIGMSGNYAGGQRLTEQEAFDRMPQGGYGINLLGSAGFGGGGYGPRRNYGRIGSAAGALGSPGTPTSQRGRFEKAMRDGASPDQAAGFADLPTHLADRATRTSPLDDLWLNSDAGRRLYSRILGEAGGAQGPPPGPLFDDVLAPMPAVPTPPPPAPEGVMDWMKEQSSQGPTMDLSPVAQPPATAPVATGPSPWNTMLGGMRSALRQPAIPPVQAKVVVPDPVKTTPYGDAMDFNDQASKISHLPLKLLKGLGSGIIRGWQEMPGNLSRWMHTPR